MPKILAVFISIGFALPSHAIILTCLARLFAKTEVKPPLKAPELEHIPKDVILKLHRIFQLRNDDSTHTTDAQPIYESYLTEINNYVGKSLASDGKPLYVITDVLGAGGQGAVFRAINRESEAEVAIKISETNPRSQQSIDLAKRMHAKATKNKTDSPLLTIFDYEQRDDWSFTVSEWLPASSFDKSFERNLPLKTRRGFIFGDVNENSLLNHVNDLSNLARAIQEIHDEGYIFTDLKPGNFSRLYKGQIKLMDLDSLASLKNGSLSLEHGFPLYTPLYASPEIMRLDKAKTKYDARIAASRIGPASDVYSFGLILNDTLEQLREHNFKYDIRLEAAINHLMKEIVPKTLNGDPAKRPTMREVELELVQFQIIIKSINLEEMKRKLSEVK